jgi:hypothetical protein
MRVRSDDAAGTMSKGAGDKVVQKHLPLMGVMRHRSAKRNIGLSCDDAVVVCAAIGIDGGGRLGCGLGLRSEGEEGEERIHWCV